MKIYTRTGDKGSTRLVGGSSVQKDHGRIEAYGTVDELNSVLGLIHAFSHQEPALKDLSDLILKLQSELFVVGGALACENASTRKNLPALSDAHITALEKQIDQMDEHLQPLRQFILPGGHPISAHFHLGRTVCRRAERNCVKLALEDRDLEIYLRYLNRLSDFLFTCARYSNHLLGAPDQLWNRP